MPRRYQSPIIPHHVVMRMHPEDVALCYDRSLGAEDVRFTPDGESPLPNSLFVRKADKGRDNDYWYFNQEIGGVAKRKSTGCKAGDRDGAIAWALAHMARLADRAKARVAPEAIPACDVFAEYAKIARGKARRDEIKACTLKGYLQKLRLLGRCFRDASVADLQAGGSRRFIEWCEARGYAPNVAVNGNNVCKRAVNAVMRDRGSAYRLDFHVGRRKPKPKKPFTPEEMDRIMDRIENGTVYGPDLKPIGRCTREQLLASIPFVTAVPLMVESGTRHEAACQVSLTDPSGPFIDLDAGILYRRGQMEVDTDNKRRGACVLSSAYMAKLRPVAEAAIARGVESLVHDRHGRPVKRLRLEVWRAILKDAQVPYRVLHCLKDTAVQIARLEGVPLYAAAERFATTPETLVAFYGADWDLGLQIDPAEAQGAQVRWRAAHAAAKARQETAATARAARAERGRPGRNARGRAVDVLATPPAAPVVGGGFVADGGAVALPVEGAERAAATPTANPEAAHNVVRLADRRPKGRR